MQVNAIDPGAIDPGVKLLKIDLLKQISRKRDAIRKEADSSTLRSYLSAVHGVVASGLDAQIKLEEAIELVVGLSVFLDELKYAPARNAFFSPSTIYG